MRGMRPGAWKNTELKETRKMPGDYWGGEGKEGEEEDNDSRIRPNTEGRRDKMIMDKH